MTVRSTCPFRDTTVFFNIPKPLKDSLFLQQAVNCATLGRLGVTQSRGDAPRAVEWVTGAAVVLRREALDEIGLFDESFFLYSEEVDLQARLHSAGWEVHYFPRVSVVHHESQFSADIPERRINEMWRSRHRYWQKHHSGAGARLAALTTGAQYAVRAALSPIAKSIEPDFGARMRLLAHDSWRVTGPGLRELADEWRVPIYAHFFERPFLDGSESYAPPDPEVGGGIMARLAGLYPRKPVDVSERLILLPDDGSKYVSLGIFD